MFGDGFQRLPAGSHNTRVFVCTQSSRVPFADREVAPSVRHECPATASFAVAATTGTGGAAVNTMHDETATVANLRLLRYAADTESMSCYFFLVVGVDLAGGAAIPKAFTVSTWQVSLK